MAMQFTPFNPNPFAVFDPSQWSNPFSSFNNAPIPSTQVQDAYQGGPGWPTNALGQPIQMPPGMTLNTPPPPPPAPAPAAPAASNYNPALAQLASNAAMNSLMANYANQGQRGGTYPVAPSFGDPVGLAIGLNAANQMNRLELTPQSQARAALFNTPGISATQIAQAEAANPSLYNPSAGSTAGAAPAAAAASSANSTGNPALTYTQYLQLLSNPGKVTTPGGDPSAAPAVQPGSGVLQQFLQNWQPAQSGPGSQFQQIFANALAPSQATPTSKKKGMS
jgi:hypothetical protein